MRRTKEDLKRCTGTYNGLGRCYFNKRLGKDTCAGHEDPEVFDAKALQAYTEQLGAERWNIECGAVPPPRRVARSLDNL